MNELTLFNGLIIGWFVLAAIVFLSLFFVVAPYGRHARSGWGATIDNRAGWVIMEAVAPLIFAACFLLGNNNSPAVLILFGLWEAHYLHRAFIYPFSLHGRAKRLPLVIMGFALVFNGVNGYLNGRYIFTFASSYGNEWLKDPRFIIGVLLFIAGFIINRQSDRILRNLRSSDESGYSITHAGLYRWVSSPNYLGELIIWLGWALATWSLPGLAFAVWAAANLIPRARSHHAWYRNNFPDYPPERKALVPGIW
ncbi:DUF1295 domain-containing protein [Chloroflexota bacterium]